MAITSQKSLVEGDVGEALKRMAIPMAMGMVFMIMVNIVDTFWVGRLGTDYVAAMTYTFPVVGLVINLALGLMIGTSTAVARAIGAGREDTAARLTTHRSCSPSSPSLSYASLASIPRMHSFRTGARGTFCD